MKQQATYYRMAGEALKLLYEYAALFSAHNISMQKSVGEKNIKWGDYEHERDAVVDMAYLGAQHEHSINITRYNGYNKVAHLVDNCVSAQLLYVMSPVNGGCVWRRRLDDITRYETDLKGLLVAYYREKDIQEAGSAADALRDAGFSSPTELPF